MYPFPVPKLFIKFFFISITNHFMLRTKNKTVLDEIWLLAEIRFFTVCLYRYRKGKDFNGRETFQH